MAASRRKRCLAGAALLLILLAPPAFAAAPAPAPPLPLVVPFLENDYGKALAEARKRNLPLFVETWAPWCHTCRSMQAYVFTDRSLAGRSAQFVWLSIDIERAGNAPFLTRFPVDGVPTFFVLDPKTEAAALRWVGGATVPQLQKLLDDGRRSVQGREKGVDEILARADRLYGEEKNANAAAAYREALSRAGPRWASAARATESLIFALQGENDDLACATTARDAYRRLRDTPSAANVAGSGLDCALDLKAEDSARAGLLADLTAAARSVVSRPRPDIAADDISSVYGSLEHEREVAGDEAGRRQLLSDHATFLEAEAAKAKTPQGRAVFDSHRLSVYLDLGQPARAIPMLKASEKDFPDDYNPPARLAMAYAAMKDYPRALLASDSALSKAYGPRKIVILTTRSRIHQDEGDLESARIAIEEAIREAEALPPGQRQEGQVESLRKKLAILPR